MATYLLLRDNKQSGPFSQDEIKAIGFKKYDLVWVEGRSAAWRYPGEIDEFKSIAPIVEEQPFDRFFKKPTEEKKFSNINNSTSKVAVVKDQSAPPKILVEAESKKIYASAPAKKTKIIEAPKKVLDEEPNNAKPLKEAAIPKPIVTNRPNADPIIPIVLENILPNTDNMVLPKTNRYLSQYIQPIMLGLVSAAVLGAGIFIGVSISKSKNNEEPINNNQALVTDAGASNKGDSQNYTVQTTSSNQALDPKPASSETELGASDNTTKSKPETKAAEVQFKPIDRTGSPITHKKDIPNNPNNNQSVLNPNLNTEQKKDSNQSYLPITHREATHRTDATVNNDPAKKDISNLVSVSANKFNVGTFGGISDLQLTVSNKTSYPLDLVMVEIQYIQANKKTFKTEHLYFRNVGAGESIMSDAPNSSRGIKVEYKVKLVNSKEASVSYSDI